MTRMNVFPFAAAVLLSACGGETVERLEVLTDPTTADFLAHTDALERVEAIPNSAFSAVVSGGGEFDGSATLVFFTGSGTQTLVGDASLDVDFQRGSISGGLDGFEGLENDVDYNGRLSLSSGEIGGDRPNTFSADVGGSLTGGGVNQIVLNGSVDGVFKGTPVRGLVAGGTADFTIFNGSGTVAPTVISIVAE